MSNYYVRLIICSIQMLGIIILFFNIISKFLLTLYYLAEDEIEKEIGEDTEEGGKRIILKLYALIKYLDKIDRII